VKTFTRQVRRLLKGAALAAAITVSVLTATAAIACRHALYRRLFLYPAQARAWAEVRQQRHPVTLDDGWNEYRGVLHAHSELSHDSKVPFPEIAAALRASGSDFIFMSDHPDADKADYAKGWKGLHDGVLFVRGYEMPSGFMPWGLPDDTVLSAAEPPEALAARIRARGGVLFFAHPEEPRLWNLPELTGMEIYNFHSDLKAADRRMLIQDLLFSFHAYPEQVLRFYCRRPTPFLQRWDELNRARRVTGIAGNDAHQNVGVLGFYTAEGRLRLTDTGHPDKTFRTIHPHLLGRLLLSACCGPLTPGRLLFRIDLDPYARTARFVGTHLLASELSEPALLDALRCGRAFVGFDLLADSRGFVCLAQGSKRQAVMGESIPLEPGLTLKAAAPCACRLTLLRDGHPVVQRESGELAWGIDRPGNYRVEAELKILDEWVPWIYANPITVTP